MKSVKKIVTMITVALAVVSCKNEYFTIEGSLADGGTQNLRAVYVTDYETLQSEWITMTNGQFEFTGINYDWTIIYFINNKRQVIARAAVKNGDNITIKGLMSDPYHISIEGNNANEEWNKFVTQNAALYMLPDRSPLNRAIEKYVTANPDHISSTLLLLNDYANIENTTNVDSLFKRISIDARPAGLVNNYFALSQQLDDEKSSNNISSLSLYNSQDSIMTITTARYKATLMYFWNKKDVRRDSVMHDIKQLYAKYEDEGRLQVVDILMSPDTTKWKSIIERDSTQWQHYWAAGGALNRNLSNINIGNTPYFLVVTSVGKQLYRGSSPADAIAAIDIQMQLK